MLLYILFSNSSLESIPSEIVHNIVLFSDSNCVYFVFSSPWAGTKADMEFLSIGKSKIESPAVIISVYCSSSIIYFKGSHLFMK